MLRKVEKQVKQNKFKEIGRNITYFFENVIR